MRRYWGAFARGEVPVWCGIEVGLAVAKELAGYAGFLVIVGVIYALVTEPAEFGAVALRAVKSLAWILGGYFAVFGLAGALWAGTSRLPSHPVRRAFLGFAAGFVIYGVVGFAMAGLERAPMDWVETAQIAAIFGTAAGVVALTCSLWGRGRSKGGRARG